MNHTTAGTVKGPHCQQCGASVQPTADNQGYSPCCNERIVLPVGQGDFRNGRWVYNVTSACDPRQCSHLDQ